MKSIYSPKVPSTIHSHNHLSMHLAFLVSIHHAPIFHPPNHPSVHLSVDSPERLLLNHEKMLGFLASRGEFNPGPETRLDSSELLCNKVLLKYKGDRESF